MTTVISVCNENDEKENEHPMVGQRQIMVNSGLNAKESLVESKQLNATTPQRDDCGGSTEPCDDATSTGDDESSEEKLGEKSSPESAQTIHALFTSTPTLHCIEEGSNEESRATPMTPSSVIKPMSVVNDSSPWMGISGERNCDENVRDIRIWQNYALGAAVSIANNATGAIALLEEITKEASNHTSLASDQSQLVERQQREIMTLRKRNAAVEEKLAIHDANKQAQGSPEQAQLIEKQKREILVLRKLNTKTEESVSKTKAAAEKAQKDLVCQLARGEKISAMLEDCETIAEERRVTIQTQQRIIEELTAKLATSATHEAPDGKFVETARVNPPQTTVEGSEEKVPQKQLRATFKEVTAGLRSLQGVLDEKLQHVEDELRAEFAQRQGMHFSRRVRQSTRTGEPSKLGLPSTLLDRCPRLSTTLSDSEDSGSDLDPAQHEPEAAADLQAPQEL